MTVSDIDINVAELVNLAGDLIKIPSFCPNETPIALFLRDYFSSRGYQVILQEVEPLLDDDEFEGSVGWKTVLACLVTPHGCMGVVLEVAAWVVAPAWLLITGAAEWLP